MKIALFGFEHYYPNGGWNDFLGIFQTPEDAIKQVNRLHGERASNAPSQTWQVVDLESSQILYTVTYKGQGRPLEIR